MWPIEMDTLESINSVIMYAFYCLVELFVKFGEIHTEFHEFRSPKVNLNFSVIFVNSDSQIAK